MYLACQNEKLKEEIKGDILQKKQRKTFWKEIATNSLLIVNQESLVIELRLLI